MTDDLRAKAEELIQPLCAAFISECIDTIAAADKDTRTFRRVRYDAEPARLPAGCPAPRLQLRWEQGEDDEICHYEMVFPLREHDIRNDAKTNHAVIELGQTKCGGGGTPYWERNPVEQRTPYRDGAHAQWDDATLNLPIFVIAPDGAFEELPRKPR